jgi:hypothetical protein
MTLKSQPIYHPIGHYYSSKTHPLPPSVEAFIDRLPLAQKMKLSAALLNQCNTVFSNAPTLSVVRPTLIDEDAAS